MKALDLGSNKVLFTVLKLVIPAMIAQFINVLYSIVDRMYVGNIAGVGDTALAAVGVCAPVTTLLSSFAFLIGTGGAPLFAMALGEKREENSKKILTNALYALVGLALLVTGITFALERPILMTFGASETTYAFAKQYLLIYAAGAIFSITATGLNQYITAQGYSGMGMLTTVIGAAANIALDPLFIFVLRMNVAGAAIATVISQFLSFLFVVSFLLWKNTKIRLRLGKCDIRLIGKIVKLGISPFIILSTDSAIIIVSNDKLLQTSGNAPAGQAFSEADRVLSTSVHTVTDLVLLPSYINRDFADVKKTLQNSGIALIGYGSASGPNRAVEAAQNAINCPLLEASISGARRAIVSITIGSNVKLIEFQDCMDEITREAGHDIDVKLGISVNERLGDEMIVSIIASDFSEEFDFTSIPQYTRPTHETAYAGLEEARDAEIRQTDASEPKTPAEEEDSILDSILPDFLKS